MSYFEEIYTYKQLNSLISNKIIKKSFWVNSTSVKELIGVKEILIGRQGTVHFKNLENIGELTYVDCDFSFFGNIKTLGKLRYVGGELRYGAPIKTLGNLEEVGGDLRPTTNELRDLGKLKKIGGTADFRGMIHLKNLGNLREVGENLNLVKSLKEEYDLSNIKVGGRIIYWNKEPKYFKGDNKLNIIEIPEWKNKGPYEFENNLVYPNKAQSDFYHKFKENFEKGIYINVGGMRNYIRYYIYALLREYNSNKDFEILKERYKKLRKHYPNLSHDTENIEVGIGRKLGLKKYIDYVLSHEEHIVWEKKLKGYMNLIECNIKNSNEDGLFEILKIGLKKSCLTKFGLENLDVVISKLIQMIRNIESEENEAFSNRFFDKGKHYKVIREDEVFVPKYYEFFFESKRLFTEKLIEHNNRNLGVPIQNKKYPNYYPTILIFAIENYIKELTREAENRVRVERNLPKVGEGWISETNLFYKIKNTFKEEKVIHHGRTKWLGLQHFDIYFPELNIAVEYQGRQHTEIVEYFGGESSFKKGIENDRIKKEKCKMNDCILIEVFPDYIFEDVKLKLIDSINLKKAAK